MDQLELDIEKDFTALDLSIRQQAILQKYGHSPSLETFSTRAGLVYDISEEGIGDILESIKSKVQSWVEGFKRKVQSLMGKENPEDFDEDAEYEMPISEETGKKYTALKVAGIALAVLAVAWLAKGGTEIAKSKIREHRFKKGLKAEAKVHANNYAQYMKNGDAYQTLQRGKGFFTSKAKFEAAQRAFKYQQEDLKALIKRDKENIKKQVNKFREGERQTNGYLWAGHKVKSFAAGKNSFGGEIFKILGRFISGITNSFASKSPNGEGGSMTKFLWEAVKGFFKVFGGAIWELLKNMASVLTGARPVSGRR